MTSVRPSAEGFLFFSIGVMGYAAKRETRELLSPLRWGMKDTRLIAM